MNKFKKKCLEISSALVATIFMFIPEALFEKYTIFPNLSIEINVIINRFLFAIFLTVIVVWRYKRYIDKRKTITIKGKDYIIEVRYGDIIEETNCKKVINFDECYTTEVGELKHQIKTTTVCGQYLLKNPNIDIDKLIVNANLKEAKKKSKFQNKIRYDSGKLVPNGDDLLMAFVKLDEEGVGRFFSFQEYIDSLLTLLEEVDKYYGQKDVCIPILGSGLTRINEQRLTQQELLDIMIMTYKLSAHKIKKPYKLCIICKENDDFSLNKIGESLL